MPSCVWLFVTPWTVARHSPLPMVFPRQEYWSGLPFPTAGDLRNPGFTPTSLASPALAGGLFTTEPPGKLVFHSNYTNLRSLQQCTRVPFSPHPCQRSFFLALFGKGILTDVKWYLAVAFICITLIISFVEHLFMCLLVGRLYVFCSAPLPILELGCSCCCWVIWVVYVHYGAKIRKQTWCSTTDEWRCFTCIWNGIFLSHKNMKSCRLWQHGWNLKILC